MSNEITMPKLSDTMEEGKIIRWLKHPGDQVRHGDALAEVETDKADMVMESFDDGVLEEIRLKEGESAPVGATIAMLRAADGASAGGTAGESRNTAASAPRAATPEALAPVENSTAKRSSTAERVTPIRPAKRRAAEKAAPQAPPEASTNAMENPASVFTKDDPEAPADADDGGAFPLSHESHPALSAHPSATPTAIAAPPPRALATTEPHPPAPHDGKLRASPLARRAADEAGIDLAQVHGSGPEGRVTKRDIDNFVREQQLFRFRRLVAPREGLPGTREELSKMRRTIAQRMAQSKREIPHFYVTVEVDMEEAVKLKKSLEVTELFEEDITYNDIIVKATALALARYTRMNASFQDDGVVIYPHINIGMAVAVEDGLIVPVIHECERLTLPEISAAAHRLVGKAARGGFSGDDLSGGTFTISNMGMLGVEHFAAVIVPPQAGILAVSAVKEKPVVRNGQLAVGKTMMLTVACDHRIIDGVVGARFVNEIKRFLENPASLLVS
ncbi:MAG TPA: 2-oxo acid dehydrogenase subunit E2 [Candidatus Binataceae bacterium]|nr:2-oxo acid dehydrogenase subunit E2 [Candidatus Binataceae bacterium]